MIRGTEYDRPNQKWRVNLDFPASGLVTTDANFVGGGGKFLEFDAQVYSVNTFGRMSAAVSYPGEDIPYKTVDVGTVPSVPLKITGSITSYNMFKNIVFYWNECTTVDKMDYRIQVSPNADYSSPIVNQIVDSNTFAFTTSVAYATTLYVRVRPRNTSYVEAWTGDATGNWLTGSTVVTASTNIPDDSVTAAMIYSDVAGVGLVPNGTTGALDVNPDGTTIETSGDTFRVKDGGISEGKLGTGAVTVNKIGDDQVTEAKIRFGSTATGATAGADTLPANPVGFVNVDIAGTVRKIPYYAA
jgi:hypothetical protein